MRLTRYQPFTASISIPNSQYLFGVVVKEDAVTPAAATVNVRHGGATGDIVVPIELAANESKAISFAYPIYLPNGIYVEVVAGTVRGAVLAEA